MTCKMPAAVKTATSIHVRSAEMSCMNVLESACGFHNEKVRARVTLGLRLSLTRSIKKQTPAFAGAQLRRGKPALEARQARNDKRRARAGLRFSRREWGEIRLARGRAPAG